MGPVYLVIFCYWVGPVPYLELFGAGPVEKNTLYILHSLLKVPVHRTLFNLDKIQHLLAGKQLLKSPSQVTIQCQSSLLQSLPSVTLKT